MSIISYKLCVCAHLSFRHFHSVAILAIFSLSFYPFLSFIFRYTFIHFHFKYLFCWVILSTHILRYTKKNCFFSFLPFSSVLLLKTKLLQVNNGKPTNDFFSFFLFVCEAIKNIQMKMTKICNLIFHDVYANNFH